MSEKLPFPRRASDKSDFADNENYLMTEQFVTFSEEWPELFDNENKKLNVSEQDSFGVVLKLKYAPFIDPRDDLNIATVFLGIKDQQKNYKKSIEIGLYMGRLYINDLFDTVNLDKSNLVEGIYLVLTVEPLANGRSTATLMALDLSGFELSRIKTGKIRAADWSGGISTGAHFKSLRIEGFHCNI